MTKARINFPAAPQIGRRQREKAEAAAKARALAPRFRFTATRWDVVPEAATGGPMTPEQAAIMALLDRVQALEMGVGRG